MAIKSVSTFYLLVICRNIPDREPHADPTEDVTEVDEVTTHNGTEDDVPRIVDVGVDDVGVDDVGYIGRVPIPPATNARY